MKIEIDGKLIIELSDTDIACLNNDLLSKTEWIKGAILGKINNCKKRMIQEWQPKLFADSAVELIPATDTGLIAMIVARDDYKDRTVRDTEELKALELQIGLEDKTDVGIS